jgi:hypothetical protein
MVLGSGFHRFDGPAHDKNGYDEDHQYQNRRNKKQKRNQILREEFSGLVFFCHTFSPVVLPAFTAKTGGD